MRPDFHAHAKQFLDACVAEELDFAATAGRLAGLLEQTYLDGHLEGLDGDPVRCSDCGSAHPDPITLLEHVQAVLKNGFLVAADTPYPCHNPVGTLEALDDYFLAHPVPTEPSP